MPKLSDRKANGKFLIRFSSDQEFKRKNPRGYKIFLACSLLGFFAPMIIFAILAFIVFPTPNSGFLLFPLVGSVIMGIGIYSVFMVKVNLSLGREVTVACIGIGALLCAIGYTLMYVPEIYAFFDESTVTFSVVALVCLIFPGVGYILFRDAVTTWLKRKGIGKNEIDRLKEGKINYWLYSALQNEYGLGALYVLNMVFVVLYPATVLLIFVLGWNINAAPYIGGLCALLSVLASVMAAFSVMQKNIKKYGKSAIFYRENKKPRKNHRRVRNDSFLRDLAEVLMPLFFGYLALAKALEFIGIDILIEL